MKTLKVKRLTKTAILPTRAYSTDAGLDLYADEYAWLEVGNTLKIRTGIAIDIPAGYYGQIQDRSSMASKGLKTGAGVLDAGFQGELSVVLHNFSANSSKLNSQEELSRAFSYGSPINYIPQGYQINKGDKIAQIVLHQIPIVSIEEVTEFPPSERGSKGFGSSGV